MILAILILSLLTQTTLDLKTYSFLNGQCGPKGSLPSCLSYLPRKSYPVKESCPVRGIKNIVTPHTGGTWKTESVCSVQCP